MHKSTIGSRNGIQIHQKLEGKTYNNPGPGEYNLSSSLLVPSATITMHLNKSRDSKDWLIKTKGPGPGEYTIKPSTGGKKYGYAIYIELEH